MTREHRIAPAFGVPVAPIGVGVGTYERGNLALRFTHAVRTVAVKDWVGRGELPGKNNRGPDIDELLAISGVGRRDDDGHSLGGPWCGVGSSAMLVLGTEAVIGLRDPRFCPIVVHAGAKRLGRNCGAAGSFVVAPRGWTILGGGTFHGEVDADRLADALLAVWHRGKTERDSWQGHVEIILGYEADTDTLITWAPNVVPRGAARQQLLKMGIVPAPGQALGHVRRHENGSWRRKLYCVATLHDAPTH